MLGHKREKYPHGPVLMKLTGTVISCISAAFPLIKVLFVVQRHSCPLTSLSLLQGMMGILPSQEIDGHRDVQGPAQMACERQSQDINLDLLNSSCKLLPY